MNESEVRVLAAIRRIVHAVDSHSKELGRALGITLPQLVVLRAIRTLGEVTAGRLSEAASLSPATVTTILDKLEARGLVVRYRSEEDRRIVHSRLTERGAQMLDAAPPFLHERFVSRFAQADSERQALLIGALEDVADMMGAPAPRGEELLPAAIPLEAEIGPLETG
jgi:DNA-binding MarR family transcriptional regulator